MAQQPYVEFTKDNTIANLDLPIKIKKGEMVTYLNRNLSSGQVETYLLVFAQGAFGYQIPTMPSSTPIENWTLNHQTAIHETGFDFDYQQEVFYVLEDRGNVYIKVHP